MQEEECTDENYIESISETTDEIIIDALREIATQDQTTLKYVWENGYTHKHNYEEVLKFVIDYIKQNVEPEELEEYYNWGIERIEKYRNSKETPNPFEKGKCILGED